MNAPSPNSLDEATLTLAASISRTMRRAGGTVVTAESLTRGSISCHLGAAEESSEWFLGGVIAYSSEVKFSLLGVERGCVITAACAQQMTAGAARLTGADLAVAVTGAGGPGSEEGQPAGTVFIAICSASSSRVQEHRFAGNPSEVIRQTTFQALAMLESATLSLAHRPGEHR